MLCARIAVFALAASSTFPLAAQETTEPGVESRWGIGIALNPTIALSSSLLGAPGLSTVYVPIRIARTVILEPEIWSLSTSESTGGSFPSEETNTVRRFGLGMLFEMPARGSLHPYVGPRVGLFTVKSSDTFGGTTNTFSRTDKYIAVAFGGQYFLASHFSLGGEALLHRTIMGDATTSGSGSSPSTDGKTTSLSAVFIARMFVR